MTSRWVRGGAGWQKPRIIASDGPSGGASGACERGLGSSWWHHEGILGDVMRGFAVTSGVKPPNGLMSGGETLSIGWHHEDGVFSGWGWRHEEGYAQTEDDVMRAYPPFREEDWPGGNNPERKHKRYVIQCLYSSKKWEICKIKNLNSNSQRP